jgi:arylsulfatase
VPTGIGPGRRRFMTKKTFDVGVDLGSPVSLDYFDRRPFRFNGKIDSVRVDLW